MGKTRAIKDALVTLISNLQYQGQNAFTEVTDSTDKDFDSYPIARVLPSPDLVSNEPGAMAQRDRTVRLQVVVHLPLEDVSRIQSETIDHILDLADILIDTLDVGDHTDQLRQIDPALDEYIMEASQVSLNPVDSQAGGLLMMVIAVAITYSKDL